MTQLIIKSKINKMLQILKYYIYLFCERFGPYEKIREYKKFNLAYTKGYSLVGRIAANGVYEPELSRRIVEELKRTQSEYFLDVGANIGLVSLNVLSELPDLRIFCIEPGPEQAKQLKMTIGLNNLSGKIRLFQCALGERSGESQFVTHSSAHNSGDGFFDTKRAGKGRFITVSVDKLDNWWRSAGSCLIKVVKIDAEGAELWILRNGEEFFRQCRPTIFMEINKRNIEPYPFQEADLLKWLNKMQYSLKTLDEDAVVESNLDYYLNKTDSFVAIPN